MRVKRINVQSVRVLNCLSPKGKWGALPMLSSYYL